MLFSTLNRNISKNELHKQLEVLRTHYKFIIERKIDPLLIVGGVSGLGKTYLLDKVCREHGVRAQSIAPKNAHAFVEKLYQYRNAPVLVIDDAKTGFASAPDTAELVKSAFGPAQKVVWDVKNAGKKGNPPSQFKVTTALVWISNFDVSDDLDAINKESRENFKAILSRSGESVYVDAPPRDVFQYCIWLATHGNMWRLQGYSISREAAEQAIAWFIKHRNHIKELSPRTLASVGREFHKMRNDDPKKVDQILRKRLSLKAIERINKKTGALYPSIEAFGTLKLVKAGQWIEETTTASVSTKAIDN